jgi:hypothetical protein
MDPLPGQITFSFASREQLDREIEIYEMQLRLLKGWIRTLKRERDRTVPAERNGDEDVLIR